MAEVDRQARNRLAEETSPYLLQHKDNPVHWQPWGPEAFAEAERTGKPVLLSVGYAACHWCHVMAHESFEDETIAGLMNQRFVNIKVDREERPDLDTIYQSALALMGEHGGWPLTMFLTPKGEPFWGGTYFPPAPRFGRPGFPDLLGRIAEAYGAGADAVGKTVASMKEGLARLSQNQSGGAIPLEVNDQVANRLVREVDPFHGGIGQAPKFPQVPVLKLLWRAWKRSGEKPYRDAVLLTMTQMSQGGIYDHLGGGYSRYAVDERWLVPHFEKMLYDNAQILELLTWLWQETGDALYAARARETVAWSLREMIAPDANGNPSGAFASSLDADSEGEEGKFYVWSAAEVDALLGADAELFKAAYEVTPLGNWERKNILNRLGDAALGSDASEAELAASRSKLLKTRGKRVRPGWDDKVLADWNGLMIGALARAAPVFGEPTWLAAAATAFDFVTTTMSMDGRLRHAWRQGRLKHPATLDDYALMSEAALALHEATGAPRYLDQVAAWLAVLERHYWDAEGGGYYMTADDTEQLIVRPKSAHDSAMPSGNGTIAAVLARMFYLTGEDAYRARAEAVIAAFSGELQRNFFPLATLLNANELLQAAQQIVLVGKRDAEDTQLLYAAVQNACLPDAVLQVVDDPAALPDGHPAAGKGAMEGAATAYVCRGVTCSLPISTPAELARALGAAPGAQIL